MARNSRATVIPLLTDLPCRRPLYPNNPPLSRVVDVAAAAKSHCEDSDAIVLLFVSSNRGSEHCRLLLQPSVSSRAVAAFEYQLVERICCVASCKRVADCQQSGETPLARSRHASRQASITVVIVAQFRQVTARRYLHHVEKVSETPARPSV
jgi:hypothetical protein